MFQGVEENPTWTGNLRGANSLNCAALQNNLDSNFNTQEVMATLSSDTGGKAFFDSNDFSPAFQRIQQDTSAYYVIGFRSTNTVMHMRDREHQPDFRSSIKERAQQCNGIRTTRDSHSQPHSRAQQRTI